jgi:hypothetical protein
VCEVEELPYSAGVKNDSAGIKNDNAGVKNDRSLTSTSP